MNPNIKPRRLTASLLMAGLVVGATLLQTPTPGLAAPVVQRASVTPRSAGVACTVVVRTTALRSGPATVYKPVKPTVFINRGEVVTASARIAKGTWVLVQTAEGAKGWTPTGFLRCGAVAALAVVTPPPTPIPTDDPTAARAPSIVVTPVPGPVALPAPQPPTLPVPPPIYFFPPSWFDAPAPEIGP